jgi:hypothetical protein
LVEREKAGRLYPTEIEWSAILQAASSMWKSGIAKAMNFETETAIVTVALKGWELGVPLMASLEGMPVIKGKPKPTGGFLEFLGARIGGRVEWIKDGRDGTAEVIAHRPGKKPVRGIFTMEDAKRAGLMVKDTYQQYPSDMLCKRALSRATWKQYSDLYFGHVPSVNEVADDDYVDEDAETVATDGGVETAPNGSAEPAAGGKTRRTKTTPATTTTAAPAGGSVAPAAAPVNGQPASPAPAAQPASAAAAAPAASEPAQAPAATGAAPVPAGAPPDMVLHFSKGDYAGKKLSDLTEPDFRKIIPGTRSALANPNLPPDRKQIHVDWLPRFEAWAAFRGILIPA